MKKTDMQDLVSVIIPVYNVEKYLCECIDSVLSQTYTNLEIVLVDDGSTDKSGEICDSYASKYAFVSVMHNKNQGPATSRRMGIERARGSYVMFLDSDDYLDSEALSFYVEQMKCSASDVVAGYFVNFYKNGKESGIPMIATEVLDCHTYEECLHEIHGTRLLLSGPVAKLYKIELFEGVDFKEDVTIGEDYSMTLQVLKNAKKVRMTNKVFYHRRMFGGNISRSGYTERHKKALDNYIEIREGLVQSYPKLKAEIFGYHMEYEMAVITAMCRNTNYDKEVIQKLQKDLKENIVLLWKTCNSPLHMKVSAWMIAYFPWLFIFLFRILYKITGR